MESSPHAQRRRSLTFHKIFFFLAIWLGGSWLIIGSLLKPMLPGQALGVLAVGLALTGLATVPVKTLMRGFTDAVPPTAGQRLWQLRPFWYAILLLPVLALSGSLGVLLGLPFAIPGTLGRWGLGLGAVVVVAGVLAGFLGSRRLVTRKLQVELEDVPEAFDGLRIVQLSDLHIGPHTSKRHLRGVVEAVQRLEPDLIVHTGDQVDDYASDVKHFADAMECLEAPLGVFAVAGNHDIYAGWRGVRRGLEDMGMTVLVNDAVAIERRGEVLWLAGTGDPAAASPSTRDGATHIDHPAPDIDRTLRAIPAGAFTVALAHNPALWPALTEGGVHLTLSGHTHHGQVSIPSRRWSLASAFLELSMGAYRRDDSLLYINPGTNFWGIPLRLGAYPEVTSLTLRRTSQEPRIVEEGVESRYTLPSLKRRRHHPSDVVPAAS